MIFVVEDQDLLCEFMYKSSLEMYIFNWQIHLLTFNAKMKFTYSFYCRIWYAAAVKIFRQINRTLIRLELSCIDNSNFLLSTYRMSHSIFATQIYSFYLEDISTIFASVILFAG